MSILLTMSDVNKTQIIPGTYRGASWADTVIPTETIVSKLSVSTTYYIKWKFRKNENPDSSRTYTAQAWAYFLLYNSSGNSKAVSGSLSKENYEALPIGKVVQLYGTFTTPTDLSNYKMLWYTARYSGSSSDWGSNGQVISGDLIDLVVSNIAFEDSNINIYRNGVINALDFYETQQDNVANISKGNFISASQFYEI